MLNTVTKSAVIGSGTMGVGIAQVLIHGGIPTVLYDLSEEQARKAKETLIKRFSRLVEKGKMSEVEKDKALGRLQVTTDIRQVYRVGVIIEAVPENIEMKQSIFKELEENCPDDTLFATNTSSLSVTEIAGVLKRPSRLAGLHFFNPAPLMPLVEIIKGTDTSKETIHLLQQFVTQIGKTAVICQDTPGFIVNRIARPFYNEALRIEKDNIASVEKIDRILKIIGGFKMGPFELQDLIGIDVNFATTKTVHNSFYGESRFRPQYQQERMVQAKRLGRKTGGGFYRYESS
ncbi:3-hydroxyacyl-CoA dehydrogenase NAD-binding domain-containing protein [Aliibacillus thermotolerans]|uniref:3-hydroxyacyl-CoA dehydrogenase NAD-binding domain-containing protein n=1 Tax=Aliibacillus thermotolerans TaxID=1834418 RepID=A0ABW0U540_9BACI|nr:3-hydroxyacyl-CoA dehydrogenase NAD-binding domain-containing protein [Aliibacillus thermotolerans]MDA3130429.1 3-hydroxybutyryl-CoA dehydrogenase [Aliibacillus thermotolerans]